MHWLPVNVRALTPRDLDVSAAGTRSHVSEEVVTDTIETSIPARLDRLPWSRFHWLVVIGLGTVWVLDGLEVTIIGSISSRLTEHGSGIGLSSASIGTAAAVYVAGACIGALFFGQLTDRFGRKRLFMITLTVYIVATVATAFAFAPWYFFLARFLTGAGIGGEYSAINSAIDELIPARVRGRVDLIINGSYWLGSAAGSGAALFFLDESVFAADVGWRVAFGVGALLGLTIMLVRRNVPESPRWLFIHGREQEAEQIVDRIERRTAKETGQQLDEPDDTITVRQRKTIPFREIAATAFKLYPRRAILGFALFVGQAFIYNGVTFNLGTLFTTFFDVSSSFVPVFVIIFAVGNLLGPLTLGRLFDTVGRKPMIVATYMGSAAIAGLMAVLLLKGGLTRWALEGLIVATFFFASAGASAAYLTVSEIFPMETRALAIAFFYAIGTAVGGIAGPLLFANLINSGSRSEVAIAFFIGAGVMALGGLAELLFGVKAEQQQLEDVAKPLSAEGAEEDQEDEREGEQDARQRRAGAQREDERRDGVRPRQREQHHVRLRRAGAGLSRLTPGPGSGEAFYSPGMVGSAGSTRRSSPRGLEREVGAIARALEEHGRLSRRALASTVGARHWGPGRFAAALREALDAGRARRVSPRTFAAVEHAHPLFETRAGDASGATPPDSSGSTRRLGS